MQTSCRRSARGMILRDLLDSEYFDTIRLTEIYRQAADSGIVQSAHRINRGEYPQFSDDFQLVRGDKQQEILLKIAALAGAARGGRAGF